MNLIILIIVLLFLSVFVYNFSKKDFISPLFSFIFPLFLSALYLFFNISRWSVDLSFKTISVIIVGSLSYILGCLLVIFFNQIFKRKKKKISLFFDYSTEKVKSNIILFFFTIFQLITLYLSYQAIKTIALRYGFSGGFSRYIYGYRYLGTYTTLPIGFGTIKNWLYYIATVSGYVWGLYIVEDVVNKKKTNLLLIINYSLSIVLFLLKGGREGAVQLILATVLMYYWRYMENRQIKSIEITKLLRIVGVFLVILLSFQSLGYVLGRTVQADPLQFIAVYLSGGIRNLDVFMEKQWQISDIFGKMTFIRLINYLGGILNIQSWRYPLDLPYQSANGNNSGNIYTTFYAYYYDFGLKGVIFLSMIIGLVCQKFYMRLKSTNNKFVLICYSYIFYTLAFSFFSNKFYEMIVEPMFLRYMLIWFVLLFIFENKWIRFK